MTGTPNTSEGTMPSLAALGKDLTRVSLRQRIVTLALPLAAVAAYFAFALSGHWIPAVFCIAAFSFLSYGSTSHDLVHRNLGLPRWVNEFFLTVIELLAFRSGHAYRASHLNHHARFPHDDDVEARAARLSLAGALLDGLVQQFRTTTWAIRHARQHRTLMVLETLTAFLLWIGCVASLPWTPVFFVYAVLMVAGSWIYPLATVYVPHNPHALSPLGQTRLFRGRVLALVAMQHLYHLEHHLYPSVPHQNWPELARRLDPWFERAGIKPIRLWF